MMRDDFNYKTNEIPNLEVYPNSFTITENIELGKGLLFIYNLKAKNDYLTEYLISFRYPDIINELTFKSNVSKYLFNLTPYTFSLHGDIKNKSENKIISFKNYFFDDVSYETLEGYLYLTYLNKNDPEYLDAPCIKIISPPRNNQPIFMILPINTEISVEIQIFFKLDINLTKE